MISTGDIKGKNYEIIGIVGANPVETSIMLKSYIIGLAY